MHVCSHREQFSDWKDGEERPSALLARRAEEGMEPDDLLCSRNAWPQKALVGRAQWKINQLPSLRKNKQA
jgi:hypothetical protein